MPFGAAWDKFCAEEDVPLDMDWLKKVKTYKGTRFGETLTVFGNGGSVFYFPHSGGSRIEV